MKTQGLFVILAALAAPVLVQSGCSVDTGESIESRGTLRVPLTATSTSGAVYRLRTATIELTGGENASIFTEDHLGETGVVLPLGTGNYQAELLPGWVLERENAGVFEPVMADLISPNPTDFTIQDQALTRVEFVFSADGDIIELGEGEVEVAIRVEDQGSTPENTDAACSDSVDNDADGFVDCQDFDCDGILTCERNEASCDDGLDNDGDGYVDCADFDCEPRPECAGMTESDQAACSDGIDNDDDGDADCADPSCLSFCSVRAPLWSYPVPSSGPHDIAAAPNGAIFYTAGGFEIGAVSSGALTWSHPGTPMGAISRRIASSPINRALVIGVAGSGQVEVTSFFPDGAGVAWNFQSPFVTPEPASVRVAADTNGGAAIAWREGGLSHVARLDPVGSLSWNVAVADGVPVQLGAIETQFGPFFALLSESPSEFTGTILTETGDVQVQFIEPIPSEFEVLGAGTVGSLGMAAYVSETLVPLVHRYEYDVNGTPLGVTPIPLPGIAVAAAAGPNGMFVVSDESGSISIFQDDGTVFSQFETNNMRTYTRLVFAPNDTVCGASVEAGLMHIDCYAY